MAAVGPNPVSRAAARNPQMPANQGYFGTGGPEFVPPSRPAFSSPGPIIGTIAPPNLAIGVQWAPGQGGDTPGGGGAATAGQTFPVETAWVDNGLVVPMSSVIRHRPGTVGWVSSRRSRA